MWIGVGIVVGDDEGAAVEWVGEGVGTIVGAKVVTGVGDRWQRN